MAVKQVTSLLLPLDHKQGDGERQRDRQTERERERERERYHVWLKFAVDR